MVKEPTYPTKIQKLSPDNLRVTWNDGHQADYAVGMLRKRCPCATCSTAIRSHAKPLVPPRMPRRMEVIKVMAMGNYAVGFHFNDGHTTGIYSYEYLRDLCPCERCSRSNKLNLE